MVLCRLKVINTYLLWHIYAHVLGNHFAIMLVCFNIFMGVLACILDNLITIMPVYALSLAYSSVFSALFLAICRQAHCFSRAVTS